MRVAASPMPFIDTPSRVGVQNASSRSTEYCLPKHEHIIASDATPHCMASRCFTNRGLRGIMHRYFTLVDWPMEAPKS